MSVFWLTPIRFEEKTTILCAGRIAMEPQEARERFLSLLKSVHPGMLLLFKSHMLLSEAEEAACGVDELPFDLSFEEAEIVFGEDALELSHCAEAYLDRLPTVTEMTEWLRVASSRITVFPEMEQGNEGIWLAAMHDWVAQGIQVILLREEE
jgi:hypothetical protein